MPKWTPYISGERAVVVGGDYIYCYALTHEESVKFAAAHNADIDALTAERDALASRINPDGAPVDVASLCLEIDEATAERDELQRRLDAILDRLPEGGVWCYTCNRASVPVREQEPYKHIPLEYNQMKTIFLCPICRRDGYAKDSCVATLRAIAEGREG